MISLIEALNFRCLRYVRQPMGPLHVLVGPNASGKTTFLDVVAFLGCLVADGLDAAVGERTENFADMVWGRSGPGFELAVEVNIPEAQHQSLAEPYRHFARMRYEIAVGSNPETDETGILAEQAILLPESRQLPVQKTFFPNPDNPPEAIIGKRKRPSKMLFRKTPGGNDNYYAEAYEKKKSGRWSPSFKLGSRKSTLGSLPADESTFPVSTWFKQLLSEGVENITLNSLEIRKTSPPGQGTGFKPDGSNLPWVIADLQKRAPARVRDWIKHLQTALPDLEDVRIAERPDDRHRYLVLVYQGGLNVPSWMASDGTLRLLALTLIAYLEDFKGIYLIEEPENGIHPRAVETMYQSLSSVYDAQILLASHSPVILKTVELGDVLCFGKTAEGATDIIAGNQHPKLRDWQGEENLGVLFAGGVLG